MKCEEFADELYNDYFFDTEIDEQYWSGGVNTTALFKSLCAEADKRGVVLTDVGEWDYDTYFYDVYRSTEKGLS
jgi:hypothetical protein